MGLDKASCDFLIHAQIRDAAIRGRVLTLGRLQLFVDPAAAKDMATVKGVGLDGEMMEEKHEHGFSEPFLRMLGAGSVESMDFSDYERATVIHDLNLPVPSAMHDQFDCIIDGGTIEHVFHFPHAIESCMRMLRPGGHYIGLTPANNQMGHGFYQFSPELYFGVFSEVNGFEVRQMLIHSPTEWYEVSDPKVVRSRVSLISSVPIMMAFIAKKVAPMQVFNIPQQSDYVDAWQVVDSIRKDLPLEGENIARHWIRKYLPTRMKTWGRALVDRILKKKIHVDGLGQIDTAQFKRVEL